MRKKIVMICILLAVSMFVLVACMPTISVYEPKRSAGFLLGIWHGWIAPLSLIVGIFDKGITIYESNNIGWWYDFGFYIAIISGFGGLSLFRRKRGQKTKNVE